MQRYDGPQRRYLGTNAFVNGLTAGAPLETARQGMSTLIAELDVDAIRKITTAAAAQVVAENTLVVKKRKEDLRGDFQVTPVVPLSGAEGKVSEGGFYTTLRSFEDYNPIGVTATSFDPSNTAVAAGLSPEIGVIVAGTARVTICSSKQWLARYTKVAETDAPTRIEVGDAMSWTVRPIPGHDGYGEVVWCLATDEDKRMGRVLARATEAVDLNHDDDSSKPFAVNILMCS